MPVHDQHNMTRQIRQILGCDGDVARVIANRLMIGDPELEKRLGDSMIWAEFARIRRERLQDAGEDILLELTIGLPFETEEIPS
jgi:hypothetical protein